MTTRIFPAQKARSSVQEGKLANQPAPPGGTTPGSRPTPPALDSATLERVRERDPAALGALFERYFGEVYGLIYRLLGERGAAEDITHDVFLKVYRSAHQLDASRDPGPWLTTIATNACRDLWRSGGYRLRQHSASIDEDSSGAEQLSRGTNDPERDALRAERERLVQQAIARLPEPLRVTVVLHDYQGLDHLEIAKLTGVNHAAARKRYSRALAALGRMLEDLQ